MPPQGVPARRCDGGSSFSSHWRSCLDTIDHVRPEPLRLRLVQRTCWLRPKRDPRLVEKLEILGDCPTLPDPGRPWPTLPDLGRPCPILADPARSWPTLADPAATREQRGSQGPQIVSISLYTYVPCIKACVATPLKLYDTTVDRPLSGRVGAFSHTDLATFALAEAIPGRSS
jgi:hypothetical protein